MEKFPQAEQYTNAGVKEALESGRLGFDEISVVATEELFQVAPKDKAFFVPSQLQVDVYSERAKALGREDLVFEITH